MAALGPSIWDAQMQIWLCEIVNCVATAILVFFCQALGQQLCFCTFDAIPRGYEGSLTKCYTRGRSTNKELKICQKKSQTRTDVALSGAVNHLNVSTHVADCCQKHASYPYRPTVPSHVTSTKNLNLPGKLDDIWIASSQISTYPPSRIKIDAYKIYKIFAPFRLTLRPFGVGCRPPLDSSQQMNRKHVFKRSCLHSATDSGRDRGRRPIFRADH